MVAVALLAALCVVAFRHQQTRLGRSRWLIAALLVAVYGFSTPAVASLLAAPLEARHPPADAPPPPPGRDALVVVLSSGEVCETHTGWTVRLDRAAWERAWAGIRLWRAVGGQLLFVGEPTPDGHASVAARMAELATASGVPAAAVRIEERSRNTWENLALNRALMAAHGDAAWLVTSAMHMPRALEVAHKLGLQPRPFSCDPRALEVRHWWSWLPDSEGPPLFEAALHEWIGLVYYRLKGYA